MALARSLAAAYIGEGCFYKERARTIATSHTTVSLIPWSWYSTGHNTYTLQAWGITPFSEHLWPRHASVCGGSAALRSCDRRPRSSSCGSAPLPLPHMPGARVEIATAVRSELLSVLNAAGSGGANEPLEDGMTTRREHKTPAVSRRVHQSRHPPDPQAPGASVPET